MSVELANAYPKKSFFIQMFTKDVSLEDCVLDLLDNSVDGLIRTQKIKLSAISQSIFRRNGSAQTQKAGVPVVRIDYSQRELTVHDTCGGIDWEYALTEAFNFGHSRQHRLGYLGVYGVGLKRALFKIGRKFRIMSRTLDSGFTCDLDVDQWLSKDDRLEDWKIPLESAPKAESARSAGTVIRITRLHEEVKMRFRDPGFEKQLVGAIERTYAFFLKEYLRIKINGREIKRFVIPVGQPKGGRASYEELKEGGVRVRILATLASKGEAGGLSAESAGWYIICNGRVVLAADKSEKSGWNTPALPQFHSKYTAFIGLVFFESENPLLLPWTTTKRDLNQESAVYLHVKDRMGIAARPIISFCNKKYPADRDEEPIEREISREVVGVSLGQLKSARPSLFEAMAPGKIKRKTTTRVQYDAENADLDRIKKHLRKAQMSANKIGRHTFDYFLKQEGLT